ncbi:pentatricopeptide repeat-containing protein At4g20770-like [Quercus lobata]|uniref:pentatricopeptide repeat-containing protein At4g20770-like n=1 Tax=Quercus lobata TaxID=97700 RepID=UPI0012444CA1|nr:pentatricopeptide repeat-containing protein At4g20770-like [Quercus lobata]XP_030925208.1 pentatricopeptide repeat-containing protein At4g20770-like [Quercus lobata]
MESKTTTHLANLLQSCIDKKSHLAGKLIHAFILRIGLASDSFLSNRLIELYSKCGKIHSAHQVFDQIPHKGVYSWNAILGAHCKAGNLHDAYTLFVKMPERNTVSWNTLISAFARSGFEKKALDAYDSMISEAFLPTRFTLASVFSACGALEDSKSGRRCHGLVIKIGLDVNMYVANALLCMYAKCGLLRDAIRVFEDMPEHNEVTFTAMMGGLVQTDRVVEALEMFRLMCRKGIGIDSVSLSSILGVCARGVCGDFGQDDLNAVLSYNVHGQQVHGLTIKLGFERDLHLNNSLLDMYAKNGDMDSAEKVFANLSEVSVVSWNVMIAGYGQKYQSEKAVEYLQRMQCSGFDPDEVTYINLLAACIKSGDIETGRRMFDSMPCPSVSSWNAMLSGYAQSGNHKEAIKLFREMQFQSVHSDRTTLAIILSSCAATGLLESGKQVHAASQKAFFHTDIYVASGLVGMYAKCGKTEMATRIFSNMSELDIVCWNSMIAGFSFNSLDMEAFTLFKQMRQNGMCPTQFSYATVLSCCAKVSSSFQGRQVHAQIAKDGYMNDIFVGIALIDMYSKCGDVDGARCFFDMMPGKNTVTWNEMIHGYAQNGHGYEAVCLYNDMISSGEKPDGITFVAVLTACSHSGLVDVGIEIFDSMHQEHGVEPFLDHYTCIIDSLGRAGRFHEAEMLIDKMPYKDDPVIWEVLLSSCRVHANVNLAKRAADELFHLDPQNSAPYVLLANIYSSLGRWDDVKAVRELMSEKQVIKEPGYSWIDYRNEMQTYKVDKDLRMVNVKAQAVSDGSFCYNG